MANIKIIGIFLIILAFVGVMVGCASNTAPQNTSSPVQNGLPTQTPASTGSTSQVQKVKLSDTKYWNYAHLVSGDSLDSSAQTALAGFSIDKKALADGTTQIALNAMDPAYKSHTYFLKVGQQLYFIETSMGDDTKTAEFNLGDDTAVIVDSEGYMVK
jgi:hypothetical protein